MSSGWAICLIANCAMAGKTDKIWFQPPDLPVGADLKALLETGGSIISALANLYQLGCIGWNPF
jgi:hypothetical protein